MFNIGEFARMGRVSVRMLRHYDAIGLLRPARVDPFSGYRSYEAAQLKRLNRLVALKDLGFSLEQVGAVLDEKVDTSELRGMLRLRQAQLAEQLAADTDRLGRVEARLRMIEREGTMSTNNVTVESVEPVLVARLSGVAKSNDSADVGPVVQGLYGELTGVLQSEGIQMAGPAIATYEPAPDGALAVGAGITVGPGVSGDAVEVIELPAIDQAAVYVHHGAMATIGEAYQILATWIEDNGYRTDGTAREVYLVGHPDPEETWQTALQMPISGN
ncbi:DNA-binding transcriptional MerR regulator [Antricoccus suffuscus]|uniref:DNA-binding transcriptional MerR regulator n=1 Tax=Antricoccus suffuscus TaxID=1629062 RepID=A0A2T1A274_9ACTN|nr:MerR family transcriptional regulator [Antricoccus suffuscus]PRZ42705.1 DNA-binding transcriptional MerR regulator [Antricoccus suffuscus]